MINSSDLKASFMQLPLKLSRIIHISFFVIADSTSSDTTFSEHATPSGQICLDNY